MSTRRPPNRGRLIVAASVVALAFAAVLLFLVVRFASRNPEQVNLGPRVFRVGSAARLAREVERRGPFLFKDPLNREREVYIQHLGQDPDAGWSGIRAYASRETIECLLRWEPASGRFVDPCTSQTYPADGAGLTTYPAQVERGVVSVDLRSARR
ncbi:MAG TPA: hypothetical protein VK988_13005 [Acidimicrobiales bacterium]|nr:hypothetical protein [Acidimicrobiales bacterium]